MKPHQEVTIITPDAATGLPCSSIPFPYEIERVGSGFRILHRLFSASIPEFFRSDAALELAVNDLIAGKTIPGDGDFSYNGQAFQFEDIHMFNLARLPEWPVLNSANLPDAGAFVSRLDGLQYCPGYPLLTQDKFNLIRRLDRAWGDSALRVKACMEGAGDSVWQRAHELPLRKINLINSDVPAYYLTEFAALRLRYPELAKLTDRSIYHWHESYIHTIGMNGMNVWEPHDRKPSFLFYLLGLSAGVSNATRIQVGEHIAYALMRGVTIQQASQYGRIWGAYDRALGSMVRQAFDLQSYLARPTPFLSSA